MVNEAISRLVAYAMRTGLIEKNEKTWAINTILDTLRLDSFTEPDIDWEDIELSRVLEHADVYARSDEGREAFMRFLRQV